MSGKSAVSAVKTRSRLVLRITGFTLIEVMITVAIVAILAAVAYPSYASYVARAKRADARGQLLQAAQFMQRFYAANDRFDTDRAGNAVIDQIPAALKRSPADGAQLFSLSVTANATSYTLTMAPLSGTTMALDPCGSFRITSVGVKSITGSMSRDECWK